MQNRHQEAFQKSVMLSHALQASWAMQNMHDKPGNLPDPDTFAFDTKKAHVAAKADGDDEGESTDMMTGLGDMGMAMAKTMYRKGKCPLPISK